MQIPVQFHPRDYQREGLAALDAGCVMNIWCWSRRGGKDFTAFGYAVKKMVETPMNVVLVFPTKQQGYEAFWTNIENDGFKTIDHIPASLIASQTNSPSNMKIILKNGSTFTLLGASEPDALRGANAKLYIFSEFVDIDSEALDVIRPIIAVNSGQVILQSTPKIDGISGGTFKILFDRAIAHMANGGTAQYASRITADRYLTADVLEDLRQETIARNGNDFKWRQEYLCDWGQSSSTSYYGAALEALKERGQICEVPYNPAHHVYTAWDLGMSDSTAITFFQYYGKKVYVIDYYETHEIGSKAIVSYILGKPYNYGWHFLPHDGSVRDSDAIQRIEKMRDYGLTNSSLLKREPVEDGINRAVEELIKSVVNTTTTTELRRKLGLYKRKFNPLTGDYEGPEHKTESHAADSVRYMFTAIAQDFDAATGSFLYSVSDYADEYETEEIGTPAMYRG
jgi:phage terminase large subunit